MNVNALAVAAQSDKAAMLPLWLSVERLIGSWACKYIKVGNGRLYDFDDLTQAAYIALADAVADYDPERGAFLSLLQYHARRCFREALGIRTAKQRPELNALSLDEPLGDDEKGVSLADMLADHGADFADGVIEREAVRQDIARIMPELDRLTEQQRRIFRLTVLEGRTVAETARLTGLTPTNARVCKDAALRALRACKAGRLIARERRTPYRHVTLAEFKQTGTSATEWAAFELM